MRTVTKASLLVASVAALAGASLAEPAQVRARWSEQAANDWYAHQPWLVGANYIPASAINQLEMWQADSFDPQRIDRELGWAESIGMNTMRVFLHDLLWHQDPNGFKGRIDTFLAIAARHHIRPLFVLFDSVWNPSPHLGQQPEPVPGVHNSGWVQSPSGAELANPAGYHELESYVKGIVGAFAKDERILGWDVWNEPPVEPPTESHWPGQEAPHKDELVRALLPQVFTWARAAGPRQPLTSGVHASSGWSSWDKWPRTAQIQLEESDILSFHSYGHPDELTHRIESLLPFKRPILCTEYMARSAGSTFESALPILKRYHVGAFNWGLVAGKTQTIYPWDSWDKPYTGEHRLTVWFHDVFQADGRPYREEETDLIRRLTGRGRDRPSR